MLLAIIGIANPYHNNIQMMSLCQTNLFFSIFSLVDGPLFFIRDEFWVPANSELKWLELALYYILNCFATSTAAIYL